MNKHCWEKLVILTSVTSNEGVTMEDLYQDFKARLASETPINLFPETPGEEGVSRTAELEDMVRRLVGRIKLLRAMLEITDKTDVEKEAANLLGEDDAG